MAAVLGPTIRYHVLAESLAPKMQAEVLSDLETAFNAQLLQTAGNGYAFTHALLRGRSTCD
jgi:hypothetical protein